MTNDVDAGAATPEDAVSRAASLYANSRGARGHEWVALWNAYRSGYVDGAAVAARASAESRRNFETLATAVAGWYAARKAWLESGPRDYAELEVAYDKASDVLAAALTPEPVEDSLQ